MAAIISAAILMGMLPAGAAAPVLARDPVVSECQANLFAEEAGQPTSCPTTSSVLEITPLAVPAGFTESIAFSGLVNPTNIEFASDGRVFVAEKSGNIKVFDNLADTTPTAFTALTTNVHNFWDRGLLGLALDPSLTDPTLPSRPWIYVLYAYDHVLGNAAQPPRWGDTCPSPPGPTTDGCVVSGRLSRFTVSGATISGPETVLIEDWCQQFPSHSIGNLAFGSDGALYVSAGDGASFNTVDYGQLGGTSGNPPPTLRNPCGDPPGGTMAPPTAEGGALRSQDLRTEGSPTGGTYPQAVLQDGPVAWYRMGEASGQMIDEMGGQAGTVVGGVARNIAGATGLSDDGAMDFDGSTGYVSVPDQPTLDVGDGPWSIELWARRDSAGGAYPTIIDKGQNAPALYFDTTSNKLNLEKSNVAAVVQESGATTDSNWHHWVVSRSADATTTRMYKDGTDVTTAFGPQTFASTTSQLLLGAFAAGGPRFFFDGGIDEVAVYKTALSGSRVAAHYSAAASQTASDPATLDGAILRLDPVTGAAFAGNPFGSSSDANKRRVIAYGLRNPFRFDVRPGTSELWVGDVGWNEWEEINRVANTGDSTVENFGWPCYEGNGRQGGYDSANVSICENLYASAPSAVTAPVYTYHHSANVVPGEACAVGSSATAGIVFYPESGGTFPAQYLGALFFADNTRDCIWWMAKGASGQPDPTTRAVFVGPAVNPVDLEIGLDGALYYVDFDGGTIRRVAFSSANQPPTAVAEAQPETGAAPLTVDFNGLGSSDPEGGALTYAWDLDGDSAFDDSTSATPTWTYTAPATVTARLRVTDPGNLTSTDSVVISASNTPPVPMIATPDAVTTWGVGDQISFSGSASDAQEGTLAATRLSWDLTMQHCPSNCHSHPIETFSGVASGSFIAPDHEYPSYLELKLTATDAHGASASTIRRLDPRTVVLSFASGPSGLQLAANGVVSPTPFTLEVIEDSTNSISAPSPQALGSTTYQFASWSDGGAATHTVAAASAETYTATYVASGSSVTVVPVADAEIRSNKATKNFGSLTTLGVRSGTLRSYLRFDVPTLGGTVTAAKLRVFVVEGGTAGGAAFVVGNGWTETGITWNNAPPISGSPLSTAGAAAVGSWVEFDVSGSISSATPVSFALSGGNTNAVDYASRTGTQAPQLVITTTP